MIASQLLLFIGTTELLLIGGLALLLFGGKKLPEMMKGLGQGVQSFKKGMNETLKEETEEAKPEQENVEEGKEDKSTDNNKQ
jgi:sec-independent protein translocase protein TatA